MSDPRPPAWNEIKEKGGVLPLLLVLWLYRLFGRWLIQALLYVVVMWYWLLSPSARQASLDYLQKLHRFAEQQSPFQQMPTWRHSYRHFIAFAEAIVDKMQGWLGEISEQRLQIYGHEHLRCYYGQGLIILVSHFGNIELLRALKSEHQQKINVLVYQKHADKFNAFLRKISSKSNVSLISVDELGMETTMILQDKLDAGEWVMIAADRVPIHSQRIQILSFLGQDAPWSQGAWILANLLKVPVIASFCYRVQQNFEVHFHPIAECVDLPRKARLPQMAVVTRRYVDLLEQHCIRAPYQWFNFYQFWNIKK
ncbi:LpxL/LpxP family acyltransferase [Acinetobacter sp. ANC 4641]|uniref:LpxL/LpxP family acyltransferase n=1 Tax=Acinetobacter sp. ANC 4641 TaxID=2529847 RepID=UPI00103C8EAD|nr:acyltransferase [Acinetobacter sp. ANC 4641]TCB11915.1 acyltransferase [Acinetobacter sp. ANC 4641]